jgi:hypothetical protein
MNHQADRRIASNSVRTATAVDTDVEMFDREVVLDALFRTLADHHAFAMTPSRVTTRPERPLAPFRFRRI